MSLYSLLASLLTRQPVKGLYVLLAMATTAVRIPLWMVWYMPKSTRPDPRWSWAQSVRTTLIRTVVWNWALIRIKFPLLLKSTSDIKDPARFVLIPPGSSSLYKGITLQDPKIKPDTISGVWYPRQIPKPVAKDTVVALHFHGGAYVTGDSRPNESAFVGTILGKHVGPSLQINYRLASNGSTYPAQLQDAISAYSYLISTGGVPASQVVLSGDSAGGNLILALLRYLAKHPVLPNPAAALLWSPWVDVSAALDLSSIPSHPNAGTDYLSSIYAHWGASQVLPKPIPPLPTPAASLSESFAKVEAEDMKQSHESAGTASTSTLAKDSAAEETTLTIHSPYLCPLYAPFASPVPMWAQAGEREVLVDSIEEFVKGMRAVTDNNIAYHVEPCANHDIILTGAQTGFVKEAHQSGEAAGEWLRSLGHQTP